MIYFNKHLSLFSNFFLTFSFVTSYVIMGLPAATPSNILAFSIPLFFIYKKNRYALHLFIVLFLCIFAYYIISQISCYLFDVKLNKSLILITENTLKSTFRTSHLTQHLYMMPGLLTFIYIYFFYENKYEKYIIYGLYLLVFYGFFEWIIFFIFRTPIEVFSNRTFGDGASGSLIQTITVAGFNILRFKSLTGEPSMYAFSVLPYLSLFFYKKKFFLSLIIFISLMLSTSSSAIIGLIIIVIFYTFGELKKISKSLKISKKFVVFITFLIIFLIISINFLNDLFQSLFLKLNLENTSGLIRYFRFYNHLEFWKNLNWVNKIFGVGFGTIRSTDMFTTLLVNTGLLGLFFYIIIFLIPLLKLNNDDENKGFKIGLVILLIVTLSSVPEFSYLSLWIFVGLSYRKIKINKRRD